MGYWESRVAKQMEALADKSIFDTCDEIAKYYKKASKKIVVDYVGLYNQIVNEVGQANIRPNHLYQFDKYYKLMEKSKEALNDLGNKEILLMNESYQKMYESVYGLLELPKAYKSADAFTNISSIKAQQVVNSIWCADGKHWSQRVWENTAHLQQSLEEGLSKAFIVGAKGSDLKKDLIESFGVSYNQADRLVRTEMAHIETVAAKERYKDSGIKKIRVLIEADACDECEKMRDQEYSVEVADELVPLHPNCRCCVVPIIN